MQREKMKGERKMKRNGNRCRGSLASPISGKFLCWLYGRARRDLKRSQKSFSHKESSDWSLGVLLCKSWRGYENRHRIWVCLVATSRWAQAGAGQCYKLLTHSAPVLCGWRAGRPAEPPAVRCSSSAKAGAQSYYYPQKHLVMLKK